MIRWQRKFIGVALAAALVAGFAAPAAAGPDGRKKVDRTLRDRAGKSGKSRVIVRFQNGHDASTEVPKLNGKLGRGLMSINGRAIELPNAAILKLADHPAVLSLHDDRPTGGSLNYAAVSVGARAAQTLHGFTGAEVGVAVVDSGITGWHDDLARLTAGRAKNGQRVVAFVDFVNGRTAPYDDNGHGTHVAGIIAGNGYDSMGARAGIAPGAHLVGLKVLDERGRGVISDVIAALDWVLANRAAHNIRVVNLSVGAAVTESYRTDPLALAARRVVDAGIVVVTAAGNLGRNDRGEMQYGAITAPGNAPWVLTVGAYSHEGTVSRSDDVMAAYSSRGPTAIDYAAKPDLVAPGTGMVSLSDPASLMYYTKSDLLLRGSFFTGYKPYLSLTGTSMASPVVAGTVALMLQANPSLTPNMVKAILQYTAQVYSGYDGLTQGAGFVNTLGAVELARFYRTARPGDTFAMPHAWSKQIIWGNQRLTGGVIRPNANAFQPGTTWGAVRDADGDNIVWGTLFGRDGDNIVWGTFDSLSADNIVWGTITDEAGDNIVWGTRFDGDNIVWGTRFDGDNIVWGTRDDGDNIVWGTRYDAENIVWGTACGGADCENIVWGTRFDGDNIVWGTRFDWDNIVWGTRFDWDNIVWGTGYIDNIVWGTGGQVDSIVWGTSSEDDNVTWGSSGADVPLFDDPLSDPVNYNGTIWENIFPAGPVGGTQTEADDSTTLSTTTASVAGGF